MISSRIKAHALILLFRNQGRNEKAERTYFEDNSFSISSMSGKRHGIFCFNNNEDIDCVIKPQSLIFSVES